VLFRSQEAGAACQLVLENFTEIPVWPQLPKISFRENMYVQYTEGMPAVVVDEEKEHVFFDTSNDLSGKVEKFYERFLAEDLEYFAIGDHYAHGFNKLLTKLKEKPPDNLLLIKGQVTGPISFGLAVPDENKKPIFYHEMLSDVIIKALGMKAKWQEKKFKEAFPGTETLIFFDEPYLTSFGSAYINISREDVIRSLSEVKSFLEGFVGVHCCGKTDWTLFSESDVDVISFDAYDYTESLVLYPKEIEAFLKKGGILAWGIIPSSFPNTEQVSKENVDSLTKRLEEKVQLLVDKGIDKELLIRSALITPNCGTASMSTELAEKAIKLAKAVSETLREKYSL
jgi:hypothetical protein